MIGTIAVLFLIAVSAPATFALGAEEQPDATDYELTEIGVYPVVNPTYEFDLAIYDPVDPRAPRDSNLSFYLQTVEAVTNVRVNVEAIESDVARESIDLLSASADLPDVLMTGAIDATTAYQYGSLGTFRSLEDLIDNYMPALRNDLEESPQYAKQLTMPDGHIYSLPSLDATCTYCQFPVKFWMYKPWFDQLELEFPPTTTDDLYQVLKSFKIGDPNGNGIDDEIPLLGAATGWNTSPLDFLMNAFTYTHAGDYGTYLSRTIEGLSFVANTTEWREGLRYINRLYSEDLIGRDTFIQRKDQAKATVENPHAELVGSFPAGWYGVMTVDGGGTGRYADFEAVPPLSGPEENRYTTYIPPEVRYHTFLTMPGDRPEIGDQLIARWADYFYDSTQKNTALDDWIPRWWIPSRASTSRQETDSLSAVYRLTNATRELYQPAQSQNYIPANLVFDYNQRTDLDTISQEINGPAGIVQRWSVDFILGVRDINSEQDWAGYINELESAGVDAYVRLWEEALRAGE